MNMTSPGRLRLFAGIARVLNRKYERERYAYGEARGDPPARSKTMRV